MVRVSSTEFQREVGRFQDVALVEPVMVTRNGRDRTVMISAEEYGRLQRSARRAYGAGEVPEEWVRLVEQSEMDPRHAHLDALIEDWQP